MRIDDKKLADLTREASSALMGMGMAKKDLKNILNSYNQGSQSRFKRGRHPPKQVLRKEKRVTFLLNNSNLIIILLFFILFFYTGIGVMCLIFKLY